jgi:outer membrane protein
MKRPAKTRSAILLSGVVAGSLLNVHAQSTTPQQPRVPDVPSISGRIDAPSAPAPQIQHAQSTDAEPSRESVSGLTPSFLRFAGPFRPAHVPSLFPGNATRLKALTRDGKLYLSLADAIDLALENNLDVEAERYNMVLAQTDMVRAAGGGNTRGVDYGLFLPPNGVGGPGSPLLTAATTNVNPTAPAITDLTSLNSTTQSQQSLSQSGAGLTYSLGPNIPLYDPQFIGDAGYLRRSDAVVLGGTNNSGVTAYQPGGVDFTTLNASYLQGFSTGGQLEAIVNNAAQVSYRGGSQLNPLSRPSSSVTFTQPLLRGFGGGTNLRYLHIASTDKKISRLLFEEQVLNTIYGISRLYFDLASLGENVGVKQQSLTAATKLREDDENQEKVGTLAPIELTRARALESASKYDLIQAQGLYRQQEIILRNQITRAASPIFQAEFDGLSEVVPTDTITVPQQLDALDVPALVTQALARRPDLAQSKLQIESGKISAAASRNNARPQLNIYGNFQSRGSVEQPYETLGSAGTGLPATPQELSFGGTKLSTIYQGGVQLTLPIRNRVAEADAARDAVQLRQVQTRTEKLAANVRQDVETAVVALQTAQAAYETASHSRDYQSQLLDAERDKLSVGQSTEEAVLQNEAYLAQAQSTEIAARSNWIKARIQLDYALGDLLEKNHIQLDDAIKGEIPAH